MVSLLRFRRVLQVHLGDKMAHFDSEDFKRMEKEDGSFKEQKRKRKKEVSMADSSFPKYSEDCIRIAWKRLYQNLTKVLSLELLPFSFPS